MGTNLSITLIHPLRISTLILKSARVHAKLDKMNVRDILRGKDANKNRQIYVNFP